MDQTDNSPQSSKISVPAAIIIAGALIAGGIYLSGDNSSAIAVAPKQAQTVQQGGENLDNINPVVKEDHLRGNPNAVVKIVEYSDTECPFCKKFHETMLKIMEEYESSGKVAWVYRHFPIDQLHPVKARNEATAFECASEQGGNDKFWAYADRLFEITPSNNNLDQAELPKIAESIGLDVNKFNSCLTSKKYDKHIESDYQNALATGGQGTPWSIVIGKNGKKYPINGAVPYDSIRQTIELALQGK